MTKYIRSPKSEDPRITRSREAILKALAILLENTSLSSISVSAVCRQARVNRSTFYRHFEDIQDVLDRGIAQVIDGIVERIGAADSENPRFSRRLLHLFQEILRQQDLIRPFLTANGQAALAPAITAYLEDFLYRERIHPVFARRGVDQSVQQQITVMTASALVGLIRSWVLEHPEWEPRNLADHYARYVEHGVLAAVQEVDQ